MSADLTIADAAGPRDVLAATIHLPRAGRWVADVTVDDAAALTGRVTLASPAAGLSLRGTVQRGGTYVEVGHVRVVGGAGGLDQRVSPVHYRGVALQLPLRGLLSEVGEVLSPRSDPGALQAYLPAWTRAAGRASTALGDLVDRVPGAVWRVQDDGVVWVGTDAYPDAVVAEYEVLEQVPSEYEAIVATEQLPNGLRPGTTFLGQRVAAVEYRLAADHLATQVLYARTPGASAHPLRDALADVARQATRATRWHKLYPARVVAQAADGTLQVIPDDATLPGLTGVPYRPLAPGVKLQVSAGARAVVAFANGDPAVPMVVGFEGGAATLAAARETDPTDNGTLVLAVAGVAGVTIGGSYTPPGGAPIALPPGPSVSVPLRGKISGGSGVVFLP